MLLRSSLVIAVVALALASCKGKTMEELRADGYQCVTKGGGGSMSMKEKEHCFVCDDNATMMKCISNPLTSGCKETTQGACQPNPK